MGNRCPECGEAYQRLAMHWNRSSCDYAGFSELQRETLIGILMGDGEVHGKQDANPHFRVRMTNRCFLEFVDDRLGILSKGVFLARSANDQYRNAVENQKAGVDGFETVNEEAYNELYGLRTCSHPYLNDLELWYESGEKRFPESLELTPEIVRMWYACDGWLAVEPDANPRAMIKATNEADRRRLLIERFSRAGFDVGFSRHSIQIPHSETVRLLDWMGDPPPGFEYKWDLNRDE